MPRLLFPRISDAVAHGLWDELMKQEIPVLSNMAATSHERAFYAQTGGQKVNQSCLEDIRKNIKEIAEKNGFPESGTRGGRASFDAECAQWIFENSGICTGEALRKQGWSFFSLVLMPDICKWRFSEFKKERLVGGVRNVFQRLWMRAFLLGKNKDSNEQWELLHELNEDTFVSITERPGLSSNPRIARAIGECWVRCSKQIGREKMENVNREAIKVIRSIYPVICLDLLQDDQLNNVLDDAYAQFVVEPLDFDGSKYFPCTECGGGGLIKNQLCEKCYGDGYWKVYKMDDSGTLGCGKCKGDGLYYGKVCNTCVGTGIIQP